MATDKDAAPSYLMEELAGLKPAVERLRGLLQAAVEAEEAAVHMEMLAGPGDPVDEDGGGPVEGSADGSGHSPTPGQTG
jgi:hypothetical protein